jgi:hypothetical protein
LVSLADISSRTGLSRSAMTHYSKGARAKNFPAPVARVTSESPLWDWATVAKWMYENDKIDLDSALAAETVKEANEAICHGETELRDRLKGHAAIFRRTARGGLANRPIPAARALPPLLPRAAAAGSLPCSSGVGGRSLTSPVATSQIASAGRVGDGAKSSAAKSALFGISSISSATLARPDPGLSPQPAAKTACARVGPRQTAASDCSRVRYSWPRGIGQRDL